MKLKLGVVMFLLIMPFSLAINSLQSHNASEIYPQEFTSGNYTFPDTIKSNFFDTISGSLISFFKNIFIDGYLHVGDDTRDLFAFASTQGDIVAEGNLFVDGVIGSYATQYGMSFVAMENDGDINFSSLGSTTTLNAAKKIVCDSTKPFVSEHDGMYFVVLSSTPSFAGATGEIKTYINSSCVELSFGSAGADLIVNAIDMNYYVFPHPIAAFLDNGFVSFMVGENPDAKFEVHILNGTGFTGAYIEDVAGADQHQALTIEQDGKGYDGIVGINQFLYSSVPVDGKSGVNVLLETDGSGVSNSHNDFIQVVVLGQSTNSEIDALHVDPRVNHIVQMGSIDTVSAVYYYNISDNLNITGNATSTVFDYTIFKNDNSVLYIGNDVNFTTIAFSLETASSANILPFYYYCNLTGQWSPLPGVIDTTAGFTVSGSISFTSPSDRGKCNKNIVGETLSPTNYSYIAIQRTRNNIVTPPVENLITLSGGTDYFILQKDMLKLQPVTAPPEVCDATTEGGIYSDDDLNLPCFCNGVNWLQFDDFSTVCS